MLIEDGTGSGKKALVDARNQLGVSASSMEDETYVSLNDSDAYIVSSGLLAIPASFDGPVLFIQNLNGVQDVVLKAMSVYVSAPSTGAAFSLLRNPSLSALSDNVANPPINLNFESGKQADAISQLWDGVGTTGIGGVTALPNGEIGPFTLETLSLVTTGMPIVLGQSDVLAVRILSGAAGFDASVAMRFYFDGTGAK